MKYPQLYFCIAFLCLFLFACDNITKKELNTAVEPSAPKISTEHQLPTTLETDKLIQAFVAEKVLKPNDVRSSSIDKDYQFGVADLNNDGKPEYFILMKNGAFCGTGGCSAYLINEQQKLLSQFTVTNDPIFVSPKTNKGWQDLVVYSNGGLRQLTFNGKTYPENPSIAPMVNRRSMFSLAKKTAKKTNSYQEGGRGLQLVPPQKLMSPYNQFLFQFHHKDDPKHTYYLTIEVNDGDAEVIPTLPQK